MSNFNMYPNFIEQVTQIFSDANSIAKDDNLSENDPVEHKYKEAFERISSSAEQIINRFQNPSPAHDSNAKDQKLNEANDKKRDEELRKAWNDLKKQVFNIAQEAKHDLEDDDDELERKDRSRKYALAVIIKKTMEMRVQVVHMSIYGNFLNPIPNNLGTKNVQQTIAQKLDQHFQNIIKFFKNFDEPKIKRMAQYFDDKDNFISSEKAYNDKVNSAECKALARDKKEAGKDVNAIDEKLKLLEDGDESSGLLGMRQLNKLLEDPSKLEPNKVNEYKQQLEALKTTYVALGGQLTNYKNIEKKLTDDYNKQIEPVKTDFDNAVAEMKKYSNDEISAYEEIVPLYNEYVALMSQAMEAQQKELQNTNSDFQIHSKPISKGEWVKNVALPVLVSEKAKDNLSKQAEPEMQNSKSENPQLKKDAKEIKNEPPALNLF